MINQNPIKRCRTNSTRLQLPRLWHSATHRTAPPLCNRRSDRRERGSGISLGNQQLNAEDPAELTFAEGKYTGEFKGISQCSRFPPPKETGTHSTPVRTDANMVRNPARQSSLRQDTRKNIVCPWPGDYRIEVSGDLKTITLTTDDTPNPNPGGPTKSLPPRRDERLGRSR